MKIQNGIFKNKIGDVMLGLFAVIGTIATPLYTGWLLKKDIQASKIDKKFKPSLSLK